VLPACTYTYAHVGNADAALRAFIPYGEALAVRDGNRYGFVISVTYAARGVGLCFIPRKLYVINFLRIHTERLIKRFIPPACRHGEARRERRARARDVNSATRNRKVNSVSSSLSSALGALPPPVSFIPERLDLNASTRRAPCRSYSPRYSRELIDEGSSVRD
jgi:hypothetical protein